MSSCPALDVSKLSLSYIFQLFHHFELLQMQDSPMGDVQAIFYTYTACIYALYCDDAAASEAGRCVSDEDDRGLRLPRRKVAVASVCCHVHPGV